MKKIIPEQIIERCSQCTNRYDPDKGGCSANMIHGARGIKDACPLKDYREDTWLDKPDSIGLWFLDDTQELFIMTELWKDTGICIAKYTDGNWKPYTYIQPYIPKVIGKWHKAIVPTIKESK